MDLSDVWMGRAPAAVRPGPMTTVLGLLLRGFLWGVGWVLGVAITLEIVARLT